MQYCTLSGLSEVGLLQVENFSEYGLQEKEKHFASK